MPFTKLDTVAEAFAENEEFELGEKERMRLAERAIRLVDGETAPAETIIKDLSQFLREEVADAVLIEEEEEYRQLVENTAYKISSIVYRLFWARKREKQAEADGRPVPPWDPSIF